MLGCTGLFEYRAVVPTHTYSCTRRATLTQYGSLLHQPFTTNSRACGAAAARRGALLRYVRYAACRGRRRRGGRAHAQRARRCYASRQYGASASPGRGTQLRCGKHQCTCIQIRALGCCDRIVMAGRRKTAAIFSLPPAAAVPHQGSLGAAGR
eukprot:COSAG01_NODE_16167_length_1263_cov_1.685567_2_plen_153_part_00